MHFCIVLYKNTSLICYLVDVELVEDVSTLRLVKDRDDCEQDLDDGETSETENVADILQDSFRQLPMTIKLPERNQTVNGKLGTIANTHFLNRSWS